MSSAVHIRYAGDDRCLYVADENQFGDRRIKAQEMSPDEAEDPRYQWIVNTRLGIINSVSDPSCCIGHDRSSLVLRNVDDLEITNMQWRFDTRSRTVTLLNTNMVMDLTSDYGRVCVWEFHGGENQLFYAVPVSNVPIFNIIMESTGQLLRNGEDGVVGLSYDADDSTTWTIGDNDIIKPFGDAEKVLSVSCGYLTLENPIVGDYHQGWVVEDGTIVCRCKPEIALRMDIDGEKIGVCKREEDEYIDFIINNI